MGAWILELGAVLALLYVAYGLWHTKTVDGVKPRRLRRSWSAADQAEFDELTGQCQGGDV